MVKLLSQLKLRQIILKIVLGLCLFLAIGSTSLSYALPSALPLAQAGSVENLQQQQQQIEQERDDIQRERDRLQNLEQSAQDRLGGLQNNIRTTAAQIQQNEAQIKAATENLKKLQAELAIAEKGFQDKQLGTVARLRFLQRQQGGQGWAVLLQSNNLNEFLDRRRQLKLVYQADRQILANLKAQFDNLNQRKRTIERQKNDIALLTQQLLAQKSQLEAQSKIQQDLIARLRQDRNALEEAEAQLERDSATIAVLIRQRLSIPGPVVRGTGQFTYPSIGIVTSNFGWRVHPILGYRRFHAGIDFGASHGSTIQAADAGVVIFSGWYGGYGNAVVISHGGDLTTLYGHASELYVSEGQTVQQGQAIAAIGSTGFSTGPHLHFEVRQNGEPVNPLGFL
ncbi:peptidoglycan DD-metalloendopeptidase family protein [Leptolyngbya sp. FACHB-671]|uniref:murein hydrolase activator EnvC family protein n=1 Tax=Leptolyngbya sp. FACHB-671 TaxID=2692812 RepID=UPI0016857F27|nr:M23 family metallopeptidase [Leptolyngbya sp. FACHB-671]MBD1867663.1 peptidoglycan DD-metalloendopeptidase family protein [Cyanobacteria bacterium FACHB-471]MBD2067410.1 peptidoglycan DD-metalloendopeptidase family protein [Leptolyngbya sp. FACHB-671]